MEKLFYVGETGSPARVEDGVGAVSTLLGKVGKWTENGGASEEEEGGGGERKEVVRKEVRKVR